MKLMIAAVAAGFGSLASAASAEQPRSKDPTVVERITYDDVDLTTAAGQKRLKDRISFAAYRLCLTDSTATPSPAVADPGCSRKKATPAWARFGRLLTEVRHALLLATF